MPASRSTHLLTVLVGLALLAPWRAAGAAPPDPACSSDEATRAPRPPSIVAPMAGVHTRPSNPVTFRVAFYRDATAFRWEAFQDGVLLQASERTAPPSDPKELIADLMATTAIVSHVRGGSPSPEADEVVDELVGLDYRVVPETLANAQWPGELTVNVSARVCGQWSDPAQEIVWVD